MGVSILPSARGPWDLIGEMIGQNLNKNLPASIQRGQDAARQIQQEQKLKQQQQAENESLKMFGVDLSGINDPKIRQNLVSSVHENEIRNKQLESIFGSNYRNQSGAPGGGNQNPNQSQNVPDLTNIPDEALARLSLVDPQRANALRYVIQNQRQQKADKQKADVEAISNDKFSQGYQALQGNDMGAFNKIMKDPQTPYEVKSRLSNLKNQQDVRKDVKAREIRTRQNFLRTAYGRAIKSERDLLAKAGYKDRPEIEKRIENLIKSHQRDMKKFSEDPESYSQLKIWNNEASKYLPEEEIENGMMGAEGQGYGGQQPNQGQKVLFNGQNPEHRSKAENLFKQHKDKEKVRQILSNEFDFDVR